MPPAQTRNPAFDRAQKVAHKLNRPRSQGFLLCQDLPKEPLQGQAHHIGAGPAQNPGRLVQLGRQFLRHPYRDPLAQPLFPKFVIPYNALYVGNLPAPRTPWWTTTPSNSPQKVASSAGAKFGVCLHTSTNTFKAA